MSHRIGEIYGSLDYRIKQIKLGTNFIGELKKMYRYLARSYFFAKSNYRCNKKTLELQEL